MCLISASWLLREDLIELPKRKWYLDVLALWVNERASLFLKRMVFVVSMHKCTCPEDALHFLCAALHPSIHPSTLPVLLISTPTWQNINDQLQLQGVEVWVKLYPEKTIIIILYCMVRCCWQWWGQWCLV